MHRIKRKKTFLQDARDVHLWSVLNATLNAFAGVFSHRHFSCYGILANRGQYFD